MDPTAQQPAPQSGRASCFQELEILDPSKPHTFLEPTKQINDGPDVAHFLTSKAYHDIGVFVMQLNRALCPRKSGSGPSRTFPLVGAQRQDPESVHKLVVLLEKAGCLIDEAPPDPGPRRFGNVSFRKWHKLLDEQAEALLKEYVSADVLGFAASSEKGDISSMGELKAYFMGGFGSSQRLDYGTGHELSFLAFLGCLWKLGAFKDGTQNGDIERSLVLSVFEP